MNNNKERLKELFEKTFNKVDKLTHGEMFSKAIRKDSEIAELEEIYTEMKELIDNL